MGLFAHLLFLSHLCLPNIIPTSAVDQSRLGHSYLMLSGYLSLHPLLTFPISLCLWLAPEDFSGSRSGPRSARTSQLTLVFHSLYLHPGHPGSESPCPRCRREAHRLRMLQEAVLSIREAQQELHR